MSTKQVSIIVHSIAEDGLPDMDKLTGKVAFIFDGCIVSGWPLGEPPDYHYPDTPYSGYWEANEDVGKGGEFAGVTHWVEFPQPLYELER